MIAFYMNPFVKSMPPPQMALKAFIKPLETPRRSVKIKIYVNFFSLSRIAAGRDNFIVSVSIAHPLLVF